MTGLLVLTLAAGLAAEAPAAETNEIVAGNSQFALDLYSRLRADQPGNLFFSPGSLSTALAMTYAGARGDTATEMGEVLHFHLPPTRLNAAFAALNRTLNADVQQRGYRLNVANRLWGQQGYRFLPAYLAITRDVYGAELAQVDFARQTEATRRQINAWVEQRTENKITELIPAGLLDPMTRLVLTNAIYFKGDWSEPFSKRATADAPFHLTGQTSVPVPLMSRQDDFRFWAGDGLKALELPYGKGDLAMVVLLPDEIEGLAKLEARLSTAGLKRWLTGLREQEVRVFLPRFKQTSQFQLADVLQAMGMSRAFSPSEADFSGMDGQRDLCLSAVIHKAYVDVNEEGTEAAAATAVEVAPAAAPYQPHEPQEFRADHPFVFLIRHVRTGSILFLGRLVNPAS
jgi:serpin B